MGNFCLSVLVVCFIIHTTSGFIVSKLLLPYYDKIQVNYTINAEEGCYKWKSLNTGVASVKAQSDDNEMDECSKSAVVYVESRAATRKTTLLLAESKLSRAVLQCDIIIDRIHSVDIVSRTRELYLDDPPETLKIRALDDEGNTFSTTAGLIFDWNLLQDSSDEYEGEKSAVPAHSILNIKRFTDTMYNAEPYVEQLEQDGKQSDTILLSGRQTGTAFVTAQLTTAVETQSAKIRLTVRDKVLLNPSGDVWLPRHSYLRYKVEQWRNGHPTEVEMPDQQYFLQLDKQPLKQILELDEASSVVTALQVGSGKLMLMDRNLKQHAVQAFSDIFVTDPAYLKFSIQPHERWVLETKLEYYITIHMFDTDNHRMWVADNVRIDTQIDPEYFKIIESSVNGSWHHVQAIKQGSVNLFANFTGTITNDELITIDSVVDATQFVEIYDPIRVAPPLVVFPWQQQPVSYKYQLTATGGSGNYSWSVMDSMLVIISNTGVVMLKVNERAPEHRIGSALVRATDIRNPAHWGEAEVMVLPVVKIEFATSRREAQLETFLDLYIVLYAMVDKSLVPVVDCRNTGVTWKVHDSAIFEEDGDQDLSTRNSTACMGKRFRAVGEGHTMATVSYKQVGADGKSILLEHSVTIAAFPPLKAIDPPILAVLSLDSSKTLRFSGGPNRWSHWHAGYERLVQIGDSNLLELSPVISSHHEHHVVTRCLELGETTVQLVVGNQPCDTNPQPVQSTISVRISCSVPSRVEVDVTQLLPSCPLRNTHSVQSVGLVNQPLHINVTAFDANGILFDNFTSMYLDWTSESDATFSHFTSHFISMDATQQKKHIVNQAVILGAEVGELTINVVLPRYIDHTDPNICRKYECTRLEPAVSGSVSILAVTMPTISPTTLVLYNQHNYTGHIKISGGSGYFTQLVKQSVEAISITDVHSNSITVAPKRAGKAEVHLTDLCLNVVTTTNVVSTEVGLLKLKAASKMEIGSSLEAVVEILDRDGHAIPIRFLSYTDLKITTNPPDIVFADKVHVTQRTSSLVVSDITAHNIGVTTLTAVATIKGGKNIVSNTLQVVVFPPLELVPAMLTLVPKASYQLTTRGGPRSDFTIEFSVLRSSSNDVTVATISQSGVVYAENVGSVSIVAQAVTHDGAVFKCKAPAKVKVVTLTGVRIIAPITQFRVGKQVPLHVEGITSDARNPLSFGSCIPGLQFTWNNGNTVVTSLHTVHAKSGVETGSDMSFTMLAEGLSSGHSTISVKVTSNDPSHKQLSEEIITAEISLTVFAPLFVMKPDNRWSSEHNLLMTPSSDHQILSNRDGVAQSIVYQVLTAVENDDQPDDCIQVSDKGLVTTGLNQCESSIQVTSMERFGINQTLTIHVMVRPVAYIIARSTIKFRSHDNDIITSFPLSSTLSFTVDQFDDTGELFDASSHDVVITQNRHDLLEIEPGPGNRQFTARVPLEGTTILSVSSYVNSKPNAVYYFPIQVSHAIKPTQPTLMVGVRQCFTSDIINTDSTNGEWNSTNSRALLVDKKFGAAVAVSTTATEIIYTTDTFSSRVPISIIPFIAGFDETSVPSHVSTGEARYLLPISFNGRDHGNCDGLDDIMNKYAQQLFDCYVTMGDYGEELFNAEVQFRPEIDNYACVVSGKPLMRDQLAKYSTIDDVIMVKLTSMSHDLGRIDQSEVPVAFSPQFVTELSSNHISGNAHVTLCIKCNERVHNSIEITPDSSMLLIQQVDDQQHHGSFCYRITKRHDDITKQNTEIRVSSFLTNQDEILDISLDNQLIQPNSKYPSHNQVSWKTDVVTDTYIAYITTAAVVIISTAFLIAAFGLFKWATSDIVHPPSTSFLQRTPPPYNPYSPIPSSSPRGSPSPSPGVRLWSRYYEPQQASPRKE
ncbi:nuclear pore membrane glycoprotein 210 [Ciona intestinalis]